VSFAAIDDSGRFHGAAQPSEFTKPAVCLRII
jgi:hypothetical protein